MTFNLKIGSKAEAGMTVINGCTMCSSFQSGSFNFFKLNIVENDSGFLVNFSCYSTHCHRLGVYPQFSLSSVSVHLADILAEEIACRLAIVHQQLIANRLDAFAERELTHSRSFTSSLKRIV